MSLIARRLRQELAELERLHPAWLALAAAARLALSGLPDEEEDLLPLDLAPYPIRPCGCARRGRHKKGCPNGAQAWNSSSSPS